MVDIQLSLQGQIMKNISNSFLTPLGLDLGYFEIALQRPFKQQGIVKLLGGQGDHGIHGGLDGLIPGILNLKASGRSPECGLIDRVTRGVPAATFTDL